MKFLHKNKSVQSTTAAPVPVATPAYYSYPPLTNAPPPVLNQPNLFYVGSTSAQTTAPVVVRDAAPVVATTVYPTTGYTQPAYLTANYSKLLRKIHLLNEAMMRLQNQRIAHERLDAKGMRVFQELQVVLTDIESFLVTKNGDMKFQQLADHFFSLAGELRNDRELSAFLSSWKASRQGNEHNIDGTINNASVLFHDIKSSRNVYQCATEALKLAEYILSSDEEQDLEGQKKKVYEEIITLLKGVGENPRWKAIAGQGKTTAAGLNERARQAVTSRPHLHLKQRPAFEFLLADLKRAIEVLMVDHDGASVDRLFKSVEEFLGVLAHSPAYHTFIKDAKEAGAEIMEDPDILSDPATRELLWNLWNTFVEMISEAKKHPSFVAAFTEAKHISKSLLADPYAHNILSHAKVLLKDVYKNDAGGLIDFSLIPQFKHILVPLMLESFREVRIPPIQGVTPDKKLKYHVSSIALSSIEMLPENIKIEATYRMNTDPLSLDVHEKDIILWVEADKVRASVTGAAWNYERLTFPRLGDAGLASLVLGGQGARVGAKIRIHKQGDEHVMQVIDSYCNISRLDLTMYECKYAVLYKMVHKHLVKQLKSVIELGIAQKLTQLVTGLDRTVLKTIMKLQTGKSAVIKTARASKGRILKKKSARTPTSTDEEKKSKKEKILTIATSSSTKRRGLSLIKKARKATESKADKHPSLDELNHAPPPAPVTNLPPLVAPSTMPLPPLVAPSTMPLPPLVAPVTTPLAPLAYVAPVTQTSSTNPLPPLVAPLTAPAPAPLSVDDEPETISLPCTPVVLAPNFGHSNNRTLTSADAAGLGIGGSHVTTAITSTPTHIAGNSATNANSDVAGIVANMEKSNVEPIVPQSHAGGIASI